MRHRSNGGIWIGAILVIFGLLLLADNFDILYYITPSDLFYHVRFFSWPFIMFIIGAIILANNPRSVPGWILIVIGGLNFTSRMFRFSVGEFVGDFWPLILIGVGLLLLLRRREPKTVYFDHDKFRDDFKNKFENDFKEKFQDKFHNQFNEKFGQNDQYTTPTGNESAGTKNSSDTQPGGVSGDDLDIVAVFNTIKRRVTSNNFLGGRISVLFGGVDLYLTDSKLAKGEQTLDISCIFGGVDIYVPRDWRVIVKTVTIFGGFDDSRFQGGTVNITDDRVLIIKGFVLFGSGDIKNG
jgi:predicted membrane protein